MVGGLSTKQGKIQGGAFLDVFVPTDPLTCEHRIIQMRKGLTRTEKDKPFIIRN